MEAGDQRRHLTHTHVKRVARRLGLTTATTPDTIEQDLVAVVPQEDWTHCSHLLIFHGRACCRARVPHCSECSVHHLCPSRRPSKMPAES